MIVKSIDILSCNGDTEADVVLTDGVVECRCFCHPCDLTVGQYLKGPISSLGATNMQRISEKKSYFRPQSGYSYVVAGIFASSDPVFVEVGGISIDLDAHPPGDLKIGDFVEFVCDRLDV